MRRITVKSTMRGQAGRSSSTETYSKTVSSNGSPPASPSSWQQKIEIFVSQERQLHSFVLFFVFFHQVQAHNMMQKHCHYSNFVHADVETFFLGKGLLKPPRVEGLTPASKRSNLTEFGLLFGIFSGTGLGPGCSVYDAQPNQCCLYQKIIATKAPPCAIAEPLDM